jgi:DNA-binding CsgD family transcriptional regulator
MTDPGPATDDRLVLALWQVVARRIEQHASAASPAYLIESRAASSVRTEAITELTDRHTTTLESLLAVLRSPGLDDRAARQTATNLAAAAMVQLRTATDRVRTFTEEPVSRAFERLKDDLRPLVRYREIDVQFVEPPVDGRALPSEVAHGARAVVRGAVLALVDQPDVGRVRVKWDCDGANLLIDVRDDGPGELTAESSPLQSLRQRVAALGGRLDLVATEGWGSQMSVVMPLDPPPVHGEDAASWNLGKRELEVLEYLASGWRNRAIASRLGISENTVKFHVSKIFRKLGVSSRAEAASLALEQHVVHSRR